MDNGKPISPHEFARSLRRQMTDAERRLRRHLRAGRFQERKFRRQRPVGTYIADFVNFQARIIVEADGGQHLESASDAQRDAWFRSQGFVVLRFWNNEILTKIDAVLESIWAAVETSPLPRPLSREGRNEVVTSLHREWNSGRLLAPLPLWERGWGGGASWRRHQNKCFRKMI
jgi:very-short-patch-repair endonuclease